MELGGIRVKTKTKIKRQISNNNQITIFKTAIATVLIL